jgi:hypothetical protein
MPQAAHSNPLVSLIIQHWESNFPKEAAELQKLGVLNRSAEKAAERAGLVLEQAAAQGLPATQAEELAVQEWGAPPNAS